MKACRANDFSDIVIVNEHRGEPTSLIVCHLPYGPTAYFNISNTVMRHDIENVGTMSEAYPHLIFSSFRHHTYTREDHKTISLTEVGPRFELRPYQIRLGTVDQDEAENEWVLHQYTNSSKKRKLLSAE